MTQLEPKVTEKKILTGRGFDVASVRADDLDRACLTHLKSKANATVLDLGCGRGGQSVRMATAGAKVTAIDSYDFTAEFASLRAEHNLTKEQLDFKLGDIITLISGLAPDTFSDVVCQRVLHYLPYQSASEVLKDLHGLVADQLFISVSGLDSAIGHTYAQRDCSIEQRFCALDMQSANTFFITQPICLYTKEDFLTLLKNSGWQIQKSWQSAFGNLKAVCVH